MRLLQARPASSVRVALGYHNTSITRECGGGLAAEVLVLLFSMQLMCSEEQIGLAESLEAEPEAVDCSELEAGVPVPVHRKRLQVGEWYVTLAMVGALVGLFVAGLLVALNQAFPEGKSGGLNAGVLTGVSIAIIVGASALGALVVGVGKLAGWGWRRARGRASPQAEDGLVPLSESEDSRGPS